MICTYTYYIYPLRNTEGMRSWRLIAEHKHSSKKSELQVLCFVYNWWPQMKFLELLKVMMLKFVTHHCSVVSTMLHGEQHPARAVQDRTATRLTWPQNMLSPNVLPLIRNSMSEKGGFSPISLTRPILSMRCWLLILLFLAHTTFQLCKIVIVFKCGIIETLFQEFVIIS